jgi:hypothetical protein
MAVPKASQIVGSAHDYLGEPASAAILNSTLKFPFLESNSTYIGVSKVPHSPSHKQHNILWIEILEFFLFNTYKQIPLNIAYPVTIYAFITHHQPGHQIQHIFSIFYIF